MLDTVVFDTLVEHFTVLVDIRGLAEEGGISTTDELLDEWTEMIEWSFEELEMDMWVAGSEREDMEMISRSTFFLSGERASFLTESGGGLFSLSRDDGSRLTRLRPGDRFIE